MRKKKVLIHSNSCLANTGFGRHSKFLLSYLYKTGKYDLVEYSSGPLNWSNPICKSMPWPCFGAMPDDPSELEQFRNDNSKIQTIQYGDYYINRILNEQKPDVLIMTEDIWGMPYLNKPWIGKFPHVFWTPVDSLPLLPVFKENKEKFGNLWVKARFAKEALNKAGIEAEYMPALIDGQDFKILSDDKKKEIRRKFGIADDTLIFGFVFRNQLRKLVGTLIEGFAMFKKDFPDVNTKLFLHTNWTESEGWRIVDFINRFGLKREDVITTYVCRECKSISVKPFFGEEMPCITCKAEKSVSTASVTVGALDEELCELYNMCDAYVHPATSGGFEMPVLEALFCGLPVATTNYAYGKNYTINEDVFPLEFFTYTERGSQFDKAQVDAKSIFQFMIKVNDLNQNKDEKKAFGQKLRDWAVEEFDGDKICKRVEDFIDALPFTEYDFDFEEKNAENKKPSIEDFIDKNSDKKRILYVEPGSLGDCLDSTTILRNLVLKYPVEEWDYYVATIFPSMFEHLEFVKETMKYDPVLDDVFAMEGIGEHKGFFDMAFHPKDARSNVDFFKNNF